MNRIYICIYQRFIKKKNITFDKLDKHVRIRNSQIYAINKYIKCTKHWRQNDF